MKIIRKTFVVIVVVFITFTISITGLLIYQKNKNVYYAKDFDIETVISKTDYDNDGIDDYTDILQGARIEAENKPTYKSAYYSGGYPPKSEGVCTDVIWRAMKNAGYSLKDMVDEDIKSNTDKYPRVEGKPDPNIDFRRVQNLKVYLDNNAIVLTNDINKIKEWQGGDIVVFKNHIGIVSDKRNKKGIPFIIHHANPYQRYYEEDILEYRNDIIGHYRIS